MAEHTAGPWSVPHFAEPDTNCECGYVLCDHMMGAIATVHCRGEGNDWQKHGDNPKFAEACANARLIAAAPELLAALKYTVEQADKDAPQRDGRSYRTPECAAAYEMCINAIAKAEGTVNIQQRGET